MTSGARDGAAPVVAEELGPHEVRWYYSTAPTAASAVLELPARADFTKLCDGDSLVLESVFRKDPQRYEDAWCAAHESALAVAQAQKRKGEAKEPASEVPDVQAQLEPEGPVVRAGYYEADISRGAIYPIYWKGQPHLLVRGSWFVEAPGQRRGVIPLPHAMARALESAWQRRAFDPTMSTEHRLQPEGVYAARVPMTQLAHAGFFALMCSRREMFLCSTDKMVSFFKWFGDGQPGARLFRGYCPCQPNAASKQQLAEEELEAFEGRAAGRAVRHLVLCVHGIGQRLSGANIAEDAREVRDRVNAMLDAQLPREVGGGYIQALPVQWRKNLDLEADVVAESIMPEGARSFRQLAHNTCVEVLLYLSPAHAQFIVNSVAINLNSTYLRFVRRHPDFAGKVSILAYSLGSVLCYDLLAHQPTSDDASAVAAAVAAAEAEAHALKAHPVPAPLQEAGDEATTEAQRGAGEGHGEVAQQVDQAPARQETSRSLLASAMSLFAGPSKRTAVTDPIQDALDQGASTLRAEAGSGVNCERRASGDSDLPRAQEASDAAADGGTSQLTADLAGAAQGTPTVRRGWGFSFPLRWLSRRQGDRFAGEPDSASTAHDADAGEERANESGASFPPHLSDKPGTAAARSRDEVAGDAPRRSSGEPSESSTPGPPLEQGAGPAKVNVAARVVVCAGAHGQERIADEGSEDVPGGGEAAPSSEEWDAVAHSEGRHLEGQLSRSSMEQRTPARPAAERPWKIVGDHSGAASGEAVQKGDASSRHAPPVGGDVARLRAAYEAARAEVVRLRRELALRDDTRLSDVEGDRGHRSTTLCSRDAPFLEEEAEREALLEGAARSPPSSAADSGMLGDASTAAPRAANETRDGCASSDSPFQHAATVVPSFDVDAAWPREDECATTGRDGMHDGVRPVEGVLERKRVELARKLWPGAALRSLDKEADQAGSQLQSRSLHYPKLCFSVDHFFMIGSPTGIFCALRGVSPAGGRALGSRAAESLFPGAAPCALPVCSRFLNIFHPFDPVAYRMEPLVAAREAQRRPALVPYHRGGKKLHIGFAEYSGTFATTLSSAMTLNFRRAADVCVSESDAAVDPDAVSYVQHLLGIPRDAPAAAAADEAAAAAQDEAGALLGTQPQYYSSELGGQSAHALRAAAMHRCAVQGVPMSNADEKLAVMMPGLVDDDNLDADASIFARKAPARLRKRNEAAAAAFDDADVRAAERRAGGADVASHNLERAVSVPAGDDARGAPWRSSKATSRVRSVAAAQGAHRVLGASAGRLDFQLQEDFVETQFFSAFTAHFCYWKHDDLALLICRAVCGYDVLDGKRLPSWQGTAPLLEDERRTHLLAANRLTDSVVNDLLHV